MAGPRIAIGSHVALVLLVMTAGSAGVYGYDQPVHLSFTMYLAELAGFPQPMSFEIAAEDQAVDDNPDMTPMPHWWNPAGGETRRALYHFVDGKRRADLEAAANKCQPKLPLFFHDVGVYSHALEDLFSHRGFAAKLGHASAGHSPDKPWYKPNEFVGMAVTKFERFRLLSAHCALGPTPPVAATAFAGARAILDTWAAEEVLAGTMSVGDADAEPRWVAATRRLYGPGYSDYTGRYVKEYADWKTRRAANKWSVQ